MSSSSTNDDSSSLSSSSLPSTLVGIKDTLGNNLLYNGIIKCKILLVGAGGIGCELLKNLSLSGFTNIEVIDLDTIDISNLNRQFLFRNIHVGQTKCSVATNVSKNMSPFIINNDNNDNDNDTDNNDNNNPKLSYKYHHGNICDNNKFNVQYISKFNLILNALDNVVARRRVNRLALAAQVPLIEAGTTGYLGQVTVIDKNSNVECYECQPKPTQKVYPICTIRSTPSMPVHTIVWSKELYKLLFSTKVEDSMLYEDTNIGKDEEETEEKEKTEESGKETTDTTSTSTYMSSVMKFRSLLLLDDNENSNDNNDSNNNDNKNKNDIICNVTKDILIGLYVTEINKKLNDGTYKTAKKTPIPLDIKEINETIDNYFLCMMTKEKTITSDKLLPPTKRNNYKTTNIWNIKDCILEFISCLFDAVSISNNNNKSNNNNNNSEEELLLLKEFDKDNDLCMKFVTCSSNLRQYVFNITPVQSLYDTKGIAGNIIPAIATTNAIVAGLQILQVFHILKKQLEHNNEHNDEHNNENNNEGENNNKPNYSNVCKYIYCNREKTRKGLYLLPTTLPKPNNKCFVCRGNGTIPLTININKWTLNDFLHTILKKELGFEQPTILLNDANDIIYEEGDGSDEELYKVNLNKLLNMLPCGGIVHGTMVRIEDFTQDLEVDICITNKELWKPSDGTNITTTTTNKDSQKEEEEQETEDGTGKYIIGGTKPIVSQSTSTTTSTSNQESSKNQQQNEKKEETTTKTKDNGGDDDDDDEIEILDDDDDDDNNKKKGEKDVTTNGSNSNNNTKKRSKIDNNGDNQEEEGRVSKRAKTTTTNNNDIIEIE